MITQMVLLQATNNGGITGVIITAATSLVVALITAWLTVWYKTKEFEKADAGIEVDENKLKTEIIKILDARKDQELNQKKFDFERVKKALEFAESSNKNSYPDKVKAVKEYLGFLDTLNANRSADAAFDEYEQYQEWVAGNTYRYANSIVEYLQKFRVEYAHAFPHVLDRIEKLRNKFRDTSYSLSDEISNEPERKSGIIFSYADEFIALRLELDELANELMAEFKELEKLKRDYLKATFEN